MGGMGGAGLGVGSVGFCVGLGGFLILDMSKEFLTEIVQRK